MTTPLERLNKKVEGKLFAYLGGMNIMGVMAGKTTDSTIKQRDMAVKDIMKELDRAYSLGRSEQRKRAVDIVDGQLKAIKQLHHIASDEKTPQHLQSDFGQVIVQLEAIASAIENDEEGV